MTPDRVLELYARERARELATPGHESSHASVLGATRTWVHHELRESEGFNMISAWTETDRLVREAGIWDEPPPARERIEITSEDVGELK